MKVAAIIGTLPQFINTAMDSKISRAPQDVREILIHACQHYYNNMSDTFFEELKMSAADYNWERVLVYDRYDASQKVDAILAK